MISTTFFWKMPNIRNTWKNWDIPASKELRGVPEFQNLTNYHTSHEAMDETQHGCIPPDTDSGAGDANREYDEIAGNREWCSVWETSMAAQLLITHVRYVLETCKES